MIEYGELQPDPLFQTDALCFVEVALREKDGNLLVHLVNGGVGRDLACAGTDDLVADNIPSVGSIGCRVRCAHKPTKVTLEPGGEELPFTFENSLLVISDPRLGIHCCAVVHDWKRA